MNNISSAIHEICIKRNKEIDSVILGEIKQIAIENGIKTEYVLNEKAIINALKKQIPKKVVPTQQPCKTRFACSICDKKLYSKQKFCDRCGQALDWGDSE